MKKTTIRISLLLLSFGLLNQLGAQTPDNIRTKFPGSNVVFQNYAQELNIMVKNDIPVAERKTDIDMLMLTEKNANMMSRYKVYHSSFNELTELEAYTRVPSGNKFKTVKVSDTKTSNSSSQSVFYDDVKETSFDFPGLVQNAIAHVNYTLYNKDAHLLTPFYLPSYLPVVNGSYKVIVPAGMNIKYVVKNDPQGLFKLSEEKRKKETVYTWTITDYKPADGFADSPDSRYFEPHVIVYISDYETKNGKQNFLSTLDDLYSWNYNFLRDLNTTQDIELKKIVDSITFKSTSEKEKAIKIYEWVQQHIKYVAFEAGQEGFRPRQAADICSKRYGDCKDMSSIITKMLQLAGLKAYFTWIGTRDIPYSYRETPLPIVDNHMIATVLIDGEWIFLDGTDPNAKFDMPPAFIQGKEALVGISEKEYKLLTVPVANPERNVLVDSTFIQINDNGIKGFETVSFNGYFGKDIYTSLLYRDEKETKDYVQRKMSKGSNKFIMGDYKIYKTKPDENLVKITADFELPGYSKKLGSEYYINMNLEKILDNQVIDLKKRKIPKETNFNYNIKQYHILDIPAGYKVTYLPKNFNFENNLFKIDMYYKIENEKIIAAQEIQNKKILILPSDFEEWNKPMEAIQPFYKESVILEKIKSN